MFLKRKLRPTGWPASQQPAAELVSNLQALPALQEFACLLAVRLVSDTCLALYSRSARVSANHQKPTAARSPVHLIKETILNLRSTPGCSRN